MPDRMPRRAQDLLHEFVDRAHELVRVQDHMNALTAAVLSMAEDLSLQAVLERVAQSAAELVGAQYAAIGLVGDDGTLNHFITVGLDEDEVQLIGDVPAGHGVLGQLIRDPRPLRLRDVHEHPLASGLPESHPPMRTFLGVPVKVREVVFGNLYLTEKDGGADFTADDEDLATALAAAAGVAIQNARLYEESRRRQRWLEASMKASAALLSDASSSAEGDLDLVAEQALKASESVLAVIAQKDADRLRVSTAVGALAIAAGEDLQCPPALQTDAELRRPVILHDPEEVFGPGKGEKLGQVLAIPLGPIAPAHRKADGGARVLLVARQAGGTPFSQTALESGGAFGSHIAMALDLNLAHRQREEELISVDRDRIAQDLHDLVIQRLFAAGLSVQGLRRFTKAREAEARIDKLTEELDKTIVELRSTIYSLRIQESREEGLTRDLVDIVNGGVRNSQITPRVQVSGQTEELPAVVRGHVLAVTREAVSNAVRHSGAESISVALSGGDGSLVLVVEDDGQGFDKPGRVSGLANIEQRAASLAGRAEIDSVPGRGTKITWSVPLSSGILRTI